MLEPLQIEMDVEPDPQLINADEWLIESFMDDRPMTVQAGECVTARAPQNWGLPLHRPARSLRYSNA